MSFLKKVTKTLFGSSSSKVNSGDVDKYAQTSQYGVNSALGNMSIKKNADGTYTKNYTTTSGDKMRNNLINQGLKNMSLDPTQTQQAYYDQATRLLNDQFDRQRTSADTNLINRGIQVGTEQYNNTMGDLINNQNGTLQDIANQAVYMGNQNIGQQISNLNSLGSGRDIYGVAALGGSNDAYANAYAQSLANTNMANQKSSAIMGAIGTGIGAGLSAWSDKRLKENLKPVGKLNNGLKVYVGNYKKETGLDTTPQLFLVAQEVQKKHPEAVGKKFGALAVDYKKAVE